MKKIFLGMIFITGLFSMSIEEKVKLLEQRVSKLEQVVFDLNKTQNVIKKTQSKKVINKCNGIKIIDFDYKNIMIGLDKGYLLSFKVKNNYSTEIQDIDVMISMIDNEDNTLIKEHLLKNGVSIKPNQIKIVNDKYIINDDLATYLGKTSKKDIILNVKPISITLSNGEIIKCNRW